MSKWRQKQCTVKQGLTEIYFDKTPNYPNVLFITNRSKDTVYIGISVVPDEIKHDKVILGYESEITGRPFEIERISIYNPSKRPVELNIYSDYIDFDYSLLKSKVECYITGVKQGTEFDVMHEALNKLGGCVTDDFIHARPSYSSQVISGYATEEMDLQMRFSEVNFLVNESEDDLSVTINNGTFILKKDEGISNFNIDGYSLRLHGDNIKASYLLRGV